MLSKKYCYIIFQYLDVFLDLNYWFPNIFCSKMHFLDQYSIYI